MDAVTAQNRSGIEPTGPVPAAVPDGSDLYRARRLSTEDFDPADRFEAWRAAAFSIVDLVPPERDDGPIVGMNLQIRGANGLFQVNEGSAHQTVFTRRASRGGAVDSVVISMMSRGTVRLEGPDGDGLLAQQDVLAAYDATRPMRYHWSEGKELCVILPRSAAIAAIGSDLTELSLPLDEHPLAPFLRSQMQLLDQHAARLPRRELAAVLDATHALALLILSGLASAGRPAETVVPSALHAAALRFIEANYSRADLTPAVIARDLGCSRASLYRAFADDDATIMDRLREVRLLRARHQLENGGGRNIALLAYRCGFPDASAFGKLFRTRFGASPRDWRAGLR